MHAALASLLAAAIAGVPVAFSPPVQLPPGELGELVALGKKLFEETRTHPLTREHVRNALSCASCHPGAGAARASTLVGAASAYPAWSPREKAVITLEDRVLNCFMRSMDGVRPAAGGKASLAITAYITWLSTGTPIAMNPESPFGPHAVPRIRFDPAKVNLATGKEVYEARCAACHGQDGQGDPPVWGSRSYNAGAGLAQVPRLASWLHVTMPPGEPLGEDDAIHVAAHVNAQPRPDFVLREHLPAPAASRYDAPMLDEVIRAPTWPPRR